MLNVFVFSNSFVAKTLIPTLDYLIDQQIDKVFVLSENHSQEDFCESNCRVIIEDNIDYCIRNCDLIIMIIDENVPEKSIEYITNVAKSEKIKYIKLNNIWGKNIDEPENFEFEKLLNNPTILLISIGAASQGYCTELAINELFCQENIEIFQFLSAPTMNLFEQINSNGLLNKNLQKQLERRYNNNTIAAITMNVKDDDIKYLDECIEKAKKASPDFIILQMEYMYNYKELKAVIEHSLYSNIDMLLSSKYISYNNSSYIYCNGELVSNVEYVTSRGFKDTLKKRIFTKLAFPEGCIPI